MGNLQQQIDRIRAAQTDVFNIRLGLLHHLEVCPEGATNIILNNIDKADRELRRLARIRRGLESKLNTTN